MKKLLSILLIGGFGLSVSAQSDLALYNFNSVPQSLHTNPAYPQQTRAWVGLPVLSGVQVYYHNNGFSPIDLFEKGTDVNENVDNVINSLDDKSVFAVNQTLDLLGVGFRISGGLLTIGAQQVTDYRMTYPVDLLKLIRFGNADMEYRDANLSSFDIETMTRTNFYIGYQKNINDKLSIGGRFKYIVGQGHAYSERTNASVETTDDSNLLIDTDILIRTAGVSNYIDNNPFDVKTSVFPENSGLGLDLGAHYKISDKWEVSASVIDLGYINWKAGRRDYVSEGEFIYEGVNTDLSNSNDLQDFDDVLDSLESAFNFQEIDSGEAYTKALPSQVFVGGTYNLNEKHALGALYHVKLWNGKAYHDFSVNYQGRVSRWFQYTVSYSIIDGTYTNVGLGMQLKAGPLQLYALSDNVLDVVFYENLKTSNVRVGMNITIFDKKTKKPKTEEVPAPANEALPEGNI